MSRRRRVRRRGGAFTLIEVLVSLAVLAVLTAAVSALLWSMEARRADITRVAAANRGATALIDGVERDLATTFVATRGGAAGVAGGSDSIVVRSRSTGLDFDENAHPHAGVTTLRIDASGTRVRAARSVGESAGELAPLTGRLERVRFRYHDGEAWGDSFESQRARRLPRAVEVAVWFARSERAEQRWSATDDEMSGGLGDDPVGAAEAFLPAAAGGDQGTGFAGGAPQQSEPPPDRLRVIAIPDAADAGDAPPGEGRG